MPIVIREKLCRKISICGLIICLIIYNYINNISELFADKNSNNFNRYFVNKSGCRIPAINASSHYLKNISKIQCPKKTLTRTSNYNGNSYLELNMDVLQILETFHVNRVNELHCVYVPFRRKNDFKNTYENPVRITLEPGIPTKVKPGTNMLRVDCLNEENKTIYRDVHFFIPPHTNYEKARCNKLNDRRLSVMVLGIDSVSHLNFLRQMKKTATFIRNELSHVEFWGYNKIGQTSLPNLMQLVSGYTEAELNFLKSSDHNESSPFIWKEFEAAGYKTSFVEDSFLDGAFNFARVGLKSQPTQFYMRPVYVEMQLIRPYYSNHPNIHCCAGRTYTQVMWEYFHKLLPYLKIYPFFSHFWNVEGSHGDINFPTILDNKYLYTLQLLQQSEILNKTLLFFMANHGFHLGTFQNAYQDRVEYAMPFLYILYPKWMEKLYPMAIINLKRNARSIVTTLDLHETMRDVLDLSKLSQNNILKRELELEEKLPRGISLFLRIPDKRTCKDAQIPRNLCLCYH